MAGSLGLIPERRWTVVSSTYRTQRSLVVDAEDRRDGGRHNDPMIVKVIQVDRMDGVVTTIIMRGLTLRGDGTTGDLWYHERFHVSTLNSTGMQRLPKWAHALFDTA